MNAALDKKIRFGDVTVDPQSNLITVVGKEKRLEPKLVALLMYLARHSQQVITRQQITETIWPSVVVGEESITQAIFSLRNALGDDAKRPKYIETIPKKGYRFLAEVVEHEQLKEHEETLAVSKTNHSFKMFGLITSLTLLCLVIGYLLLPKAHDEIDSILPVTKMPGAECCIAIRHQKMAFINVLDTASDIYIKDLVTGTQERITNDNWRKSPPSWLDDNTLIYPRCSNTECQIVQQSLHESPRVIYTSAYYIGQLAVDPSNPNIFIFNEQNNNSNFISYDLRSGKKEVLRDRYPDLPVNSFNPQFSQDGKKLYLSIYPKPAIMSLNLSTKKIEAITDQFDEITSFSINTSQQIIVAGTYKSKSGLWSVSGINEKPLLIMRPSSDEQFQFPLINETEKAIYYQSVLFDRDINIISDHNDNSDDFIELNSTGIDNDATLSNDGQFIYFVSNRTGYSEVWRHDRTNKQSKLITNLKMGKVTRVLPSNDGQRFSATYIDNMEFMFGVFSVHTGELLASIKSHSYSLSWSPDDKSIYVKDYDNNFPILSRYDSQTLKRTEIQKNAGLFAQASADGKIITFIDFEKNKLIERNIATNEEQVLVNADFKLNEIWTGRLRLDSTGTAMLVVKPARNGYQLWQYPFELTGGSPRKLMDFPQEAQVTYINDDGTLVFYDKEMPATGSIMKIELK